MELTIVIIVLGALAAFGFPRYMESIEKSKSGEGVQILTALLNAQKVLQQSTGAYTNNLGALEITINTPKYFNAPTISTNTASLASIVSKSGGGYTLTIDQNGVVTCADGTTTGICQKLGY